MVIYGWRSARIKSETLIHACPACKAEALSYEGHQRFAHIYWIPFFPMNKTHFLRCEACERLVEKGDMSPVELELIEGPSRKASTPPWMFSAFAVIALAIGAASMVQKREANRT